MTKPKPKDQDLLTPPEAARALGMADPRGEKLKRMVFAYERAHGIELFIKGGTATKPSYKVTIAGLKKAFPQKFLRGKVDKIIEDIRPYTRNIESRMETVVREHASEHVYPQIRELQGDIRALTTCLNTVVAAVNKLKLRRARQK